MGNLSMIPGIQTVTKTGTSRVLVTRPDLTNATNATSSTTNWGFGSWVTMASSGDLGGHSLIGLAIATGHINSGCQIQVGTGTAGSEAAILDYSWNPQGTAEFGTVAVHPAVVIPANARVAVRFADQLGSADSAQIRGIFAPRPF